MRNRQEIPWTFDARDIPQGWVRLASFGGGGGGRQHSRKYNVIHRAIRIGEIKEDEVIKIKMTASDPRGPIYVDPKAVDRVMAHADSVVEDGLKEPGKRQGSSHTEAAAIALCEINNTLSLAYGLLERLTQAVEAMATQPAQESGSWRGVNGESL
jgi:hypothetical protein